MGKTTVQILPTTSYGTATGNYLGGSADFVSDEFKGDGYYGFSDGVHTAQVRVTSFIGTVKLQASLEKTPTSTDWVDISGSAITGDGSTAVTNSYFWNFTGNYVWIRASVSDFTAGTINTLMMAN
jgi:hypothetical protein|tara:strand:+ start:34 stop:408 length:375 start_codon:yes stop_codon:yes gene_type:complete